MSDIHDKAQGYLSRCLQALYPKIEILPDLLGVCTQIDNVLAGQQAENARLREALQWLLNDLEDYPASARPLAAYDNARAALGEKE